MAYQVTAAEQSQLDALAARVSWEVRDPDLLVMAMAHRSWCAEHGQAESNERLEFLGDAVLGLIVTDHIYKAYTDRAEGDLAKIRASVVNAVSLAEVADSLQIGQALLLGKGEAASGGREKESILADATEALIGAMYLDVGQAAAGVLVLGLLEAKISEAFAGPGGQDYKTRLQELCARRYETLPRYELTSSGPDHAKSFFAVVSLGGEDLGRGRGRSKKQAEQAAAKDAWSHLPGTPG